MKSERRHELQQNELASKLEAMLVEVRPYTPLILGSLAVLLVGSLVWAYISGTRLAERQQGWSQFQDALAVDQSVQLDAMLDVAEQNQGTDPGYWALQTAADMQASEVVDLYLNDQEAAEEKLLAARENYKKVTNASVDDKLLSQRAWLGLAKAEESLYGVTGDSSHYDASVKAYEKLSKSWPDSSVAKVADSRLAFLQRNDGKQFYQWLAQYEPPTQPMGPPGQGGFNPMNPSENRPLGNIQLGNSPLENGEGRNELQIPNDLQLPDFDLGSDPNQEPDTSESSPPENLQLPIEETTDPAGDNQPPAEAPAENTTPEETPTEETPTEETPAEETPAEEPPADDAPSDENPVEETAVEEAPVDKESPVEESEPATEP